jgi:signal transduction histidine kinase
MDRELILVATITLIILVAMIIILFVTFQSKKNKYILDQLEAEKKREEEIAKSKMEIQEQSLRNIGWELHDNIGQILSTAKMQLNILKPRLPNEHHQSLGEVSDLIGDSLQEIRLLSKTLNPDVIRNLGLVRSIGFELERFNKLKFLNATLSINGEEVALDQKDEIILFRILQEFFSNAIKHSKASTLTVLLEYLPEKLLITAQDNGVGFDVQKSMTGSGLINMKSRALMIGGTYAIKSSPNEGVNLLLCYNYRKK